jgi:thiol-disulfide isomerase/thioredoxin
MNRWITLALAAALAAAPAGCGGGDAGGRVGVREGNLAPEFSALSLDGKAVTLQDLAGKPAVLVFWASWCGPCRQEMPHVNELVRAYGDQIRVMGINLGEAPDVVAGVAGAMDYPVLLDERSTIAGRYAVRTIPLVVVLDAAGRIRYRGNGLPQRSHALIDWLLEAGT